MDHFFNIFFVFRKIVKNLKEGQIVLYITSNNGKVMCSSKEVKT